MSLEEKWSKQKKKTIKFLCCSQFCGRIQFRAQNCGGKPHYLCGDISGLWILGRGPVFSQLSVCPYSLATALLSHLVLHPQTETTLAAPSPVHTWLLPVLAEPLFMSLPSLFVRGGLVVTTADSPRSLISFHSSPGEERIATSYCLLPCIWLLSQASVCSAERVVLLHSLL